MTIVVLARSAAALAGDHPWGQGTGTDVVVFTADPVGLDVGQPDPAGPGPALDVRFAADFATSASIELNVLALARRQPISAIWVTDPRDAVRAGALRDYLGVPGQGRDSALTFADLPTLRTALEAAGVPVVPSAAVRRPADVFRAAHELGLPLRVRRRRAPGWPEVTVLRSHADVERLTAEPLGSEPDTVPSLLVEVPTAGERVRVVAGAVAPGPAGAAEAPRLAAAVAAALPVPAGHELTVDLIVADDGPLVVDTATVRPAPATAGAAAPEVGDIRQERVTP